VHLFFLPHLPPAPKFVPKHSPVFWDRNNKQHPSTCDILVSTTLKILLLFSLIVVVVDQQQFFLNNFLAQKQARRGQELSNRFGECSKQMMRNLPRKNGNNARARIL